MYIFPIVLSLEPEETAIAKGNDNEFACCKCGKIIETSEYGYACKTDNKKRIFCESCQDIWNTTIVSDPECKLDLIKNKEHFHIKFIRRTN